MGLTVKWISDPTPVWGEIRSYLVDDNNELELVGTFAGVFEEDIMAGAFLVKPLNPHCYEIHGGVQPDFWGRGPEICDIVGRSLFFGTPCLKIIAIIPEFNRLMRACVQKIGMRQEGIIKKSFLKWMKLHDQYLYGICKSEVKSNILGGVPWHLQH